MLLEISEERRKAKNDVVDGGFVVVIVPRGLSAPLNPERLSKKAEAHAHTLLSMAKARKRRAR